MLLRLTWRMSSKTRRQATIKTDDNMTTTSGISEQAMRAINTVALGKGFTLTHRQRLAVAVSSDPQRAFDYCREQGARDWEDATMQQQFERIASWIKTEWPINH
jgi:hypothetical protein